MQGAWKKEQFELEGAWEKGALLRPSLEERLGSSCGEAAMIS